MKISVNGNAQLAHKVAWFYVYGEWLLEIDHKNRIRSDNRITNLRKATRNQNNMNSLGWRKEKRKFDLPRGVYHYPQCPNRYRAQIVVNKKQIHLGCFDSILLAQKAYAEAAYKYFGSFACKLII
jgi:hypothetical protein